METHKLETRHRLRRVLWEYGIVVFGVITALAAQQAVESLHRRQQRQQLEQDLREEMRLNDPYLLSDVKTVYANYEWAVRESQTIQAAVQGNAISTLKYEPYPKINFVVPRESVWQHARESGTLALLPRDEAQAYTALYRVGDVLKDRIGKWFDASGKQEAIGIRFHHGIESSPDLSHMTSAQLEQLSAVLAEEATSARYVLTSLGRMTAMQGVLEKGSWSQEELLKAPRDPSNPVEKLLEPAPIASAEPEKSN